jgi:hypothetical protein
MTRIYVNGRLVAASSAFSAFYLRRWNLLYIGMDYNAKENTCLGGSYGPYLLARRAWAPAQVAQWAADPWGFMTPEWKTQYEAPTPAALVCDARSRPAIKTDKQSRPAVAHDQQSRPRFKTDKQSRPRFKTDQQSRPALITDITNRGADT